MATKTNKSTDKYKPNQFVVHPHHGAAKVVRKVNKNVEVFFEGETKSKRIAPLNKIEKTKSQEA